jgi:predicted ATPase with chaperone activity
MITRLFSAALRGVEAQEVEVEVNAHGADKPIIVIVGLPDAAVRESSQRVTSAIGASALRLEDEVDFDEVKGRHHVKRVLEVAAASNHNLLMVGG